MSAATSEPTSAQTPHGIATGGTTGQGGSRIGPSLRRIAPRRRRRLGTAALVVLLALGVGFGVGRFTAPTEDLRGLVVLEREVLPIASDADGLWTGGSANLPAVGEQLAAVRRADGDIAQRERVAELVPQWLNAYDVAVRRLVLVDVPPEVRPVQRELVAAVTASRDAVELVGAAASAELPEQRRDLSSEALRRRTRAEQLMQSARASVGDLSGRAADGVAPPAELPTLEQLR